MKREEKKIEENYQPLKRLIKSLQRDRFLFNIMLVWKIKIEKTPTHTKASARLKTGGKKLNANISITLPWNSPPEGFKFIPIKE